MNWGIIKYKFFKIIADSVGKTATAQSLHIRPSCNFKRTITTANESELLQPTVRDEGSRLDVFLPRWSRTLNFSYVWLRDHCRCQQCYNHKTFQRISDVQGINLNVRPAIVDAKDEFVTIQWPDGHKSDYPYKFLWENTYESRMASRKNYARPWTKNTLPHLDDISVPLPTLEASTSGKKDFMNALLTFGFAFVTEVPPSNEATRACVEQLFAVKRTFFGEMWSFEANLEHSDTAYSNQYLGPHTDTTYFSEAVRLQVFHCLQAAPKGGETLLVDGFSIAQELKEKHTKSFEFLASKATGGEYMGDGQHHSNEDVVFRLHPVTGEIVQFRYNIYDRAPLCSLPFSEVDHYYNHLQTLTRVVRKPRYEHWIGLQPGRVLFIDNWRVMHGRAQYEGPRVMGGCYVDNADFTSKARVLGFKT